MDAIYLDHAATTPLRSEVHEAMEPLAAEFGNPSSPHRWGRAARRALESAREEAAAALGAAPGEVFFVSGGTESDNLAVLGRTLPAPDGHGPGTAALSTVEHSAVREAADLLEHAGGRALRIGVSPDGALDEDALEAALAAGSHVFSLVWVNNEVGLRLPVEEVAERTRAREVVLHSDAVQALGRVPVSVARVPVDLLTVSAHKLGGPRGVGLLFVREGVELAPRAVGGGQEAGLRSGTENVAGAVGLARALSLAVEEQEAEAARLGRLRARLEEGLREALPDVVVHGEGARRAPHILSVGLPGLPADLLLPALDAEGVAVSPGSACASGVPGPGPTLLALYGEPARERAPLRFSLGRSTTREDIVQAVERTARVATRVREAGVS